MKQIKFRIKDTGGNWHYYNIGKAQGKGDDLLFDWEPNRLREENYQKETLELLDESNNKDEIEDFTPPCYAEEKESIKVTNNNVKTTEWDRCRRCGYPWKFHYNYKDECVSEVECPNENNMPNPKEANKLPEVDMSNEIKKGEEVDEKDFDFDEDESEEFQKGI